MRGGTAGGCSRASPDTPSPPQDPRHLQYFADLTESNIYYVTQGKKLYGTPTEFGFCIKVGMSLPVAGSFPAPPPAQGLSVPSEPPGAAP